LLKMPKLLEEQKKARQKSKQKEEKPMKFLDWAKPIFKEKAEDILPNQGKPKKKKVPSIPKPGKHHGGHRIFYWRK